MSRLPDDFYQDRALRDAARDVLVADIEHARASLSGKAIAGRVAGRVGDGAKDVLEVAKGHADDKRGILAIIIAFIALWFAREPIDEIFREVYSELAEATIEPERGAEPRTTGDTP